MYNPAKPCCLKRFSIALLIVTAAAVLAQAAEMDSNTNTSAAKLHTLVSFENDDASIDTVLKDLAAQADVFIVKSPRVTGNISLHVKDVPLAEVLTNVLAAYDFTYIATDNMIRVVPLSEAAALRETLVTEIYQITYADVAEVAKALEQFISPQYGKIAINKGTSHIIVTDSENQIKAIAKFIEEIDKATPQVLVEVRMYDLKSDKEFELEAEWDISRNTPTVTTQNIGTSSNSDVSTISAVDLDSSLTTELDGTITDTDITKNNMPTGTSTLSDQTSLRTSTEKRRKPKVGAKFDKKDGGQISFSLLNDAVDIDFALSMLSSTIEAKLLANPRVMVLDNETAIFETVRQIPYTERTLTTGNDAITSTQFKPVGVQLNVTPHIARDGMIRLKIQPEFGVVVELDENGAPTIDTRRAETTTLIKDGQTIVMGGLRNRETRKKVDKVPLFGDMPVIGPLFRAESESEENSELVLFITTRIINKPRLSGKELLQLSEMQFDTSQKNEDMLEVTDFLEL